MSAYRDDFKCPRCAIVQVILRRSTSAGKKVATYCSFCRKTFKVVAGKPKEGKWPSPPSRRTGLRRA